MDPNDVFGKTNVKAAMRSAAGWLERCGDVAEYGRMVWYPVQR